MISDEMLTVCIPTLKVLQRQQTLETDVVRVAVDRGFVRARMDLLWFLGGEWIGSSVSDVHLQLQQDLQGALELHLTVGNRKMARKSIYQI